jgi:hypothetical protein
MAIYHLNVRGCSPATGAGAVKKAAYQSGQTLIEERTGEVCDYARKERVLDEGLALPAGVPPVGRGELWNEAERVRQAARRSSVRWASVVANVKNGEGQKPSPFR